MALRLSRTLGIAVALLALSGCGQTAVPSTTTTRLQKQEAEATELLDPDGIGVATTGEPEGQVVAYATADFGTPTSTVPGVCPSTVEVQYADLALEFTNGIFTGYRFRVGGFPSPESTVPPAGPLTPDLKTTAGATLGMTLAQVRRLYPTSDFTLEQGGAIAVRGTKTGDRLFLGFFSDLPTARLSEIKGGSPCGDI